MITAVQCRRNYYNIRKSKGEIGVRRSVSTKRTGNHVMWPFLFSRQGIVECACSLAFVVPTCSVSQ
jgi:hypothetical protein